MKLSWWVVKLLYLVYQNFFGPPFGVKTTGHAWWSFLKEWLIDMVNSKIGITPISASCSDDQQVLWSASKILEWTISYHLVDEVWSNLKGVMLPRHRGYIFRPLNTEWIRTVCIGAESHIHVVPTKKRSRIGETSECIVVLHSWLLVGFEWKSLNKESYVLSLILSASQGLRIQRASQSKEDFRGHRQI